MSNKPRNTQGAAGLSRTVLKATDAPVCPYCGQPATYYADASIVLRVNGIGSVWLCRDCDAWVGCRPGSLRPLGRLANAHLRRAKIAAQLEFDPLWVTGRMPRAEAWRWLAQRLGIPRRQCDLGKFDVGLCVRVVEICSAEHNARRR